MKNLFLVLSFLVTSITFSQCYKPKRNYDVDSHFGIVANFGTLKSLGGEIYIKLNNHIIGGGYTGEINGVKVENQEFKNEALYLTYGYRYQFYTIGVRYGKQNKASWIPTQSNPNTNEKVVTPYSSMIGGYVGYSLTDRVAINLGYDTFSKVTIGLVMGF